MLLGEIEVGGRLNVPPLPGLESERFVTGGSARRSTTGYDMPPFQGFVSRPILDFACVSNNCNCARCISAAGPPHQQEMDIRFMGRTGAP
jgi:hypothetical protein